MRYVIFLDIDGVLNSVGYLQTDQKAIEYFKKAPDMAYVEDTPRFMRFNLDPSAVRNLNYVLDQLPGEKEVWISSSWGKHFSLSEIRKALRSRGMGDRVKLIKDITPRKMSSWRCNEIHWALQEIKDSGVKDIRWMSIDDHAPVFSKDYMDTAMKVDGFKMSYDPDYKVDKYNGLTYQDARSILTSLIPGWKPKKEPDL